MIKFHRRKKEIRYEETARTMTVLKKKLFVEMIKKFSAQKGDDLRAKCWGSWL